jgi:hypothetical protein
MHLNGKNCYNKNTQSFRIQVFKYESPSGDLNNLVFRARELKQLGNREASEEALMELPGITDSIVKSFKSHLD